MRRNDVSSAKRWDSRVCLAVVLLPWFLQLDAALAGTSSDSSKDSKDTKGSSALDTTGVTCHVERVPMRDGVQLYTEIYLPSSALPIDPVTATPLATNTERRPVVVIRNP